MNISCKMIVTKLCTNNNKDCETLQRFLFILTVARLILPNNNSSRSSNTRHSEMFTTNMRRPSLLQLAQRSIRHGSEAGVRSSSVTRLSLLTGGTSAIHIGACGVQWRLLERNIQRHRAQQTRIGGGLWNFVTRLGASRPAGLRTIHHGPAIRCQATRSCAVFMLLPLLLPLVLLLHGERRRKTAGM